MYLLWRKTVADYSTRQLEQEQDRLFALSSISRQFETQLDDQLVAGIWKKRLVQHLAWWVQPDHVYQRIHDLPPLKSPSFTRPTSYSCPTWSWTSVLGRISYDTISTYGYDKERDWREAQNFQPDTKVERLIVHSDASGLNITGCVTLKGSLFKAFTRPGDDSVLFLSSKNSSSEDFEKVMPDEAWRLGAYSPPYSLEHKFEPWYPDIKPHSYSELYCFHLGRGGSSRGVPI